MKQLYLFFGGGEKNEPLNLVLAGETPQNKCRKIVRGKENDLTVFQFIVEGRGSYEDETIRCSPRAGDLLITPRYREHWYEPDPRMPWSKSWLNIVGPLPGELLSLYHLESCRLFRNSLRAGAFLRETVQALPKMERSGVNAYVALRIHRLIQMLAESENRFQPAEESPAHRLRQYLQSCVTAPAPSVEAMAQVVHRSPSRTIRIFKETFGITPYRFLLDRKIETAEGMLLHTKYSLHEIASMLGFADEFYFSRIFKKKRGVAPGRFRTGGEWTI